MSTSSFTASGAGTGAWAWALSPGFEVDVEDLDGAVVLRLRGELDLATAPELRRAISVGLAADATGIVVDLAKLTFIDSTGITELLTGHDLARAGGRSFLLRHPGRVVLKTLRLIGVDGLLAVAPAGASPS